MTSLKFNFKWGHTSSFLLKNECLSQYWHFVNYFLWFYTFPELSKPKLIIPLMHIIGLFTPQCGLIPYTSSIVSVKCKIQIQKWDLNNIFVIIPNNCNHDCKQFTDTLGSRYRAVLVIGPYSLSGHIQLSGQNGP